MMVRYTLRVAALASTCLLPLTAQAADDFDIGGTAQSTAAPGGYHNEIDVGGQYQSEKSARFGRFTGQTDKSGYALGGFTVQGRDDAASQGTQYWDFEGSDLGLTSRSVSGAYGYQGSWGIKFTYDGIPYNGSDSFHTIYDTSGKGTVPPGLNTIAGAGNPTTSPYPGIPFNATPTGTTGFTNNANMPALVPYTNVQKIGTQRDVIGLTGLYHINSEWSLTGALRHEHKEGNLENSLGFNSNDSLGHSNTNRVCNLTVSNGALVCHNGTGSNNIFAFPEPVNYDTDRYDAKVKYDTARLQGEFGYSFMKFADNNTSFNAIDPIPLFGNANNNQVAGRAAFALPPSNSEHEINGAISYDLTDRTRLNADLAYGIQMQDATMPATTLDPLSAFDASDAAAIMSNPNHIDGTVQNFYGNFAVVSHPLSKLNLKASYTIDDRKDDTRVSSFFRPIQDSPTEGTEADAISRMSFNDQKAKLEASYNVLSRTKVTLGYTFTQKNESYGQFSQTRENALTGKVRSALLDNVDGALAYTHSNRYGMGSWVSSRDPNAVQATGTYVYYEAPRTHDEVKGNLSVIPRNEFAIGLSTKLAQDHYNDVAQAAAPYNVDAPGLRNDHNVNVGPDLAYTPNKALSTHLFYNYQKVFYDNRILTPIAGLLGSSNLAHYGTTDETHTVGAGITWQAASKLKLGASYSFAYGNTAIDVTDGATAAYIASTASASTYAVQPLPDATSQLHTLSLHGEYQFQPNMSLWVGYSFERLMYSDWAYDSGVSSSIFGNALLPGDLNPSYAVHTVGVALRVKW